MALISPSILSLEFFCKNSIYLRVRLRERFVNPQLLKRLAVYKIKEHPCKYDICWWYSRLRQVYTPVTDMLASRDYEGHLKDFSASNYFSLSYSYEILTLLSIVLILFCNLQCSIVIIYGVRDGVFCCAGKLRNIIGPEFTLADYNLPVLLADIYISLEAS